MSKVEAAFKEHRVVPDIITTAPKEVLKVTYPNGMQVNLGAELTPRQVKDEPKVEWNADPAAFYTLIMNDPDAPSRRDPKMREVLHWLVVNINGEDVKTGHVIKPYVGAGAPQGTGLHRYAFFLFKQPEKIEFEEANAPDNREGRLNFSVTKFAEKYNLDNPIAANFFQAQWDDYVPILQKKVMGK